MSLFSPLSHIFYYLQLDAFLPDILPQNVKSDKVPKMALIAFEDKMADYTYVYFLPSHISLNHN